MYFCGASQMLDKCFATELQIQPSPVFLMRFFFFQTTFGQQIFNECLLCLSHCGNVFPPSNKNIKIIILHEHIRFSFCNWYHCIQFFLLQSINLVLGRTKINREKLGSQNLEGGWCNNYGHPALGIPKQSVSKVIMQRGRMTVREIIKRIPALENVLSSLNTRK